MDKNKGKADIKILGSCPIFLDFFPFLKNCEQDYGRSTFNFDSVRAEGHLKQTAELYHQYDYQT